MSVVVLDSWELMFERTRIGLQAQAALELDLIEHETDPLVDPIDRICWARKMQRDAAHSTPCSKHVRAQFISRSR